jgi:hypothetical protein
MAWYAGDSESPLMVASSRVSMELIYTTRRAGPASISTSSHGDVRMVVAIPATSFAAFWLSFSSFVFTPASTSTGTTGSCHVRNHHRMSRAASGLPHEARQSSLTQACERTWLKAYA